jgi:hypothetical protein
MKRSEITKKYSDVLDKMPVNPKAGDRFIMSPDLSIEKQLLKCKEGKNKIFYMKVKSVDNEINIELVSESVYISPTEYV